jgi:hypothetical protein
MTLQVSGQQTPGDGREQNILYISVVITKRLVTGREQLCTWSVWTYVPSGTTAYLDDGATGLAVTF